MTTAAVLEVMEERGVSERRAQEILKQSREVPAENGETEPSPSQKDMVIAAIYKFPHATRELRDLMARIRADNKELMGLSDTHNLAHVLWSLQKQGMVTFYTKNRGSMVIISKFKLTAQGTARALEMFPMDPYVEEPKKLKYPDTTDPRNYGIKAEGGPIERVIPRPKTAADYYDSPPPQNERPYFTIVDLKKRAEIMATPRFGRKPAIPVIEEAQAEEPKVVTIINTTSETGPTATSVTLAPAERIINEYPIIRSMIGNAEDIIMAAGLLRKAGQTDLAELAEGSIENIALVRELVDLWKEASR